MKLRPAARTIAVPFVEELSAAPLPIVMSSPAPVVTRMAPLEAIDPSEIDCASLKVNAPSVPVVEIAPT